MIAHFYLINESLAYPATNPSQEEIEDAMKIFLLDYSFIKTYKNENITYFDESVFPVVLFPNITVEDFLGYPEKTKGWDKDLVRDFQMIWDKQDNFTTASAISNLFDYDENECFGLIGLHPVSSFEGNPISPIFVVCNKYNWLDFRRHFLGLYPKNGEYFIDECSKYFPNLYFHERNKETVKKVLSDYPKKIINYLSCLNDKFLDSLKAESSNLSKVLEHFSSSCALDSDATLQGSNKDSLNFDFVDKSGQTATICCEPHLKFHINDRGEELSRSQSNSHKRIYFHAGFPHIQNGKILIGHIGDHL